MPTQAFPSEPSPLPRISLRRLVVQGFKSLKDVDLDDLQRISVFVGPNGAGKSNILSALRVIPLLRAGNLRSWTEKQGGPDAILHGGLKQTQSLRMRLEFASERGLFAYEVRLTHSRGGLFFEEEKGEFKEHDAPTWQTHLTGSGHRDSLLEAVEWSNHPTAHALRYAIRRMSFFHFHDTSDASALRQVSRADDIGYLRSYGSNLPSYLRMLHDSRRPDDQAAWKTISGLIRRVAPFIQTVRPSIVGLSAAMDEETSILDVQDPSSSVRLQWTDQQGRAFNAYDLSDGTLRSLALFTALAQPWDRRPRFITIDEPELGLHPAALNLFCALCHTVSIDSQLFLATQSLPLLNAFDVTSVIVTEQRGGETVIKKLSPADLDIWLEDYSLAEIFEKNIIGGYP
jgi:predicted ATPase